MNVGSRSRGTVKNLSIPCSIRDVLVSRRNNTKRRSPWCPSFVVQWSVAIAPWKPSTWFSVASPFREEEEREEKLPVMAARGRRKRALGFGAA
jgi:hypothetical protein